MNRFVLDSLSHTGSATATRMSPRARIMAAAMAMLMASIGQSAFAQNNAISHGYLTGSWQDNPQCTGSETMVFFPNNTMSSAGSIPVNYSVTGPSQFTMHGPGGAASIQAQYVNQNQMVVTFQNDASVFYRCGAANARAVSNAQLTPAYIVGGWGHNGNCRAPEEFAAGGQFRTSNNDRGTWALSGNQLRMMLGNGNGIDFSVQVNGQRNMTLTQNNNGQVSQYTRCF